LSRGFLRTMKSKSSASHGTSALGGVFRQNLWSTGNALNSQESHKRVRMEPISFSSVTAKSESSIKWWWWVPNIGWE
jgi:hypothetical protein